MNNTSEQKNGHGVMRRHFVLGLLILIGFGIATLSPQHLLVESKAIQAVSHALGKIFPPVAAYVEKSQFPSVTALYFSFMWPLSPVFFIWHIRELNRTVRFGTPASTQKLIFFGLPVILVFYGCVYFMLFVNPGYEFNLLPISRSRFALGVAGWLFAGGGAFGLLAVCVNLTNRLFQILNQRLFS